MQNVGFPFLQFDPQEGCSGNLDFQFLFPWHGETATKFSLQLSIWPVCLVIKISKCSEGENLRKSQLTSEHLSLVFNLAILVILQCLRAIFCLFTCMIAYSSLVFDPACVVVSEGELVQYLLLGRISQRVAQSQYFSSWHLKTCTV